MVECVIREKIVDNEHELTFLRHERNESAHGDIPDQERRQKMLNRSQYLAGLYIGKIAEFASKRRTMLKEVESQD